MGADDDGLGNRPQAPARGDTFYLSGSIVAIAASADQAGVGATLNLIECAIVASVKKILHQAADGGQILWRGKQVTLSIQQVLRASLGSVEQAHINRTFALGSLTRGLHHLESAACIGVVDDQQSGAQVHDWIIGSVWLSSEILHEIAIFKVLLLIACCFKHTLRHA